MSLYSFKVELSRAELQNEWHHWSLCSANVICLVVKSLQSHDKKKALCKRTVSVHCMCFVLCWAHCIWPWFWLWMYGNCAKLSNLTSACILLNFHIKYFKWMLWKIINSIFYVMYQILMKHVFTSCFSVGKNYILTLHCWPLCFVRLVRSAVQVLNMKPSLQGSGWNLSPRIIEGLNVNCQMTDFIKVHWVSDVNKK